MSELNSVNLYEYCSTFPRTPDKEIYHDAFLQQIYDAFSQNRCVISVEGSPASGKTVFLSQFARHYPDRVFSFFIGEDYWTSNPQVFLQDMCEQMKHCPELNEGGKLSNLDITLLSDSQLMSLFNSFLRELRKAIKRGKGPFFIVVDGMQNVRPNYDGDELRKIIPQGNSDGLYILLSGQPGMKYHAEVSTWPPQLFSLNDTKIYLEDLNLDAKAIQKIRMVSQGMPGYLSELRRQYFSGVGIEELLSSIPSNLLSLMENEWKRVENNDADLSVLALIAFSPEPLTVTTLSSIAQKTTLAVREELSRLRIVQENSVTCNLELHLYYDFVISKLQHLRDSSYQILIDYFRTNTEDAGHVRHLPVLYKFRNDYESMIRIIRPESLINQVSKGRGVLLVRRNLKLLVEMAAQRGDWQRVAIATLSEALITEIVMSPPALKDHVEALIALGCHEEALDIALKSVLPEDILRLLTPVCKHLRSQHIDIPDSARKALEDAVGCIDNTILLTPWIVEGLYDIAADLFSIDSDLALNLLKHISEYKGSSTENGDLIDMLCVKLATKLGPADESTEKVRSQIENEDLRKFISATPEFIENASLDDLYAQVKTLNDLSAKLFLLRSWCNANRKNTQIPDVVITALDIITEAERHTPTLIYLRQFAEFIVYFNDRELALIAKEKVDRLKDVALKNPIEELARLELQLGKIEVQFGFVEGEDRLFQVYLNCLDQIDEDAKCYILGHLYSYVPSILPKDEKLLAEIKEQLRDSYDRLLQSSADHLELTRKFLTSLAKHDPILASKFGEKINLETRRDTIFNEIARVYTNRSIENIDFQFLFSLIERIKDQPLREWVFTQALKKLVKKEEYPELAIKFKFINYLPNLGNFRAKAYCCACLLKWFASDESKMETLYNGVIDSLEKISPKWESIEIGYDLVKVISKFNKNLGDKLFLDVTKIQYGGPCSESRLAESYIRTIRLSIRVLKDFAHTSSFSAKVDLLIKAIEQLPSESDKCSLLCAIAHVCLRADAMDLFRATMKRCSLIIEGCQDHNIYLGNLLVAAPMIFELERQDLFQKISSISIEYKDRILNNILEYIITKACHDEPVDMSTFIGRIDYLEAQKCCEIIEHFDCDIYLSKAIQLIVSSLTETDGRFKSRALLPEKQLIMIVDRLHKVIMGKLPYKSNIQHEGYVIICLSHLTRLKTAATREASFRGKLWGNMCPTWDELKKMTDLIPNISDRVFIFANLSEEAAKVDLGWSQTFASCAEALLPDISNRIDKPDRYYSVAKAHDAGSNKEAAGFLLKTAADLANTAMDRRNKEQLLGLIIEQAYTIDVNLANSLAGKVDDATIMTQLKNEIAGMSLKSDPTKLNQLSPIEQRRSIPDAIRRIYSSFMSGRTMIQHPDVPGRWIQKSMEFDPITIDIAISWYIENNLLRSTRPGYIPELENLFAGLIETLETMHSLSTFLGHSAATELPSSFYQALDVNVIPIPIGQGDRAINYIKDWMQRNAQEKLIIYEPYFEARFLNILRVVNLDSRVKIVTARKTSEIESVETEFKDMWKSACDQPPPQTTVYVFHTSSGKTPIHDRYIIADDAGLDLGTSLNGFGNKDSTIKLLSSDKKEVIESDIIIKLIVTPPRIYKEMKLGMLVFTL